VRPLVSVVIPCFNQGRYLSAAIESVLAQSHAPTEIIVVDDGSTDETAAVAAREGARITYVRLERNRGAAAARNAGLRRSGGSYLQFLDADDLLERGKLACHVAYLEAHPDIDIAYGDVRYFSNEEPSARALGPHATGTGQPWVPELWAAPGRFVDKIAARNLLAVHCALLRRRVWTRVGDWDESLRGMEDWEYWVRCAAAGVRFQLVMGDETLALVRRHDASTSTTRDAARQREASFEVAVAILRRRRARQERRERTRWLIAEAEALGRRGRARRHWKIARASRSLAGAASVLLGTLCGAGRAAAWERRLAAWAARRAPGGARAGAEERRGTPPSPD